MIRRAAILCAAMLGFAAPLHAASEDKGWQLVWSDEFDGTEISDANWTHEQDCWGGGNDERQCYTASPANSFVADGSLHIVARRESHTGPNVPMDRPGRDVADRVTRDFTSARLRTKGKASWRYGRIEVRARLPQGQGVWPAIWMMPEESAYGSWAASGEIDILEVVNLGEPCADCPGGVENTILGTLHYGGQPPANEYASTRYSFPDVLEGFHTYGIVWNEGEFVWTVDGREFARKNAGDWSTTASADPNAPFDRPFYLILNLAIGGRWPEGENSKGVSTEGFPKEMEIDWVRVWQREE